MENTSDKTYESLVSRVKFENTSLISNNSISVIDIDSGNE